MGYICDELYKPQTSVEIVFYVIFGTESIFSTTNRKKGNEKKKEECDMF